MNGREPSRDALLRHAGLLPPIFGRLVWELRRRAGTDYAGTTSGGAMSATVNRAAEGRAPGFLGRGDPIQLERRFNATENPAERLAVVHEAAGELRRLPRPSAVRAADPPDYRTSPPGRPRSTTASEERELRDRITGVAEMRSGLTFATLLETVGPGRKPHADLVASVLAELDAGATLAAVGRAMPEVTRRTVERWRQSKCHMKPPDN